MNSIKTSVNKEGWMIIKINIKKAFDTIFWTFIANMLHLFNFPLELKKLIISCLKQVQYTPIINGRKTQLFRPLRGIGQGDPIPPYIFILGMEFLNHLIQNKIITKNNILSNLGTKPKISPFSLLTTFLSSVKPTPQTLKPLVNF